MKKENITFKELKEELAKLNDDQLAQTVVLYREDEGVLVAGLSEEPEDRYVNQGDPEDQGTLEQLKEWHGEELVLSDYRLIPKGRPFLWEEV